MALGDPRRDDADHAGVPVLGGEHVRGRRPVLGHLRLGGEQDAGLDVAALRVHRVELRGDGPRPVGVPGQQQLEAGVRPVQAAGGVDPRGEPEADRPGIDHTRVHARDFHQRSQPRLARAGQRPQPRAHEPAVLAVERHDVGHRGERDEIEVLVRHAGVLARGLEQRMGELVRDRGGAQVGARVAAGRGVHDRRGRQPPVGARGVVVGHHDVEPGRARGRHLLDCRDRAVDGHQQVRSALGEPGDGGGGEAVAVVDPARQIPVHLRAQRAQSSHEHRGGGDAVDIVVAVDRDPGAAAGVVEDHRGGVPKAAEGVERMRLGGG